MKSKYTRLKWKLFGWSVLTAVGAFGICTAILYFLVDGILQEPFANGIVLFAQKALYMSEGQALSFYHFLFQNAKTTWMIVGFTVILLICFYFSMSAFTRRLVQVEEGIDQLGTSAEGEEILLPPELESISRKLNGVRRTLQQRTRDAKEAEQRKNDLVMYLAHDIKTPLTSVIAYLSLLDEAPDMPLEQRSKYVGITLKKAYRLEQLMDEFFEITRFNLHSIVLEKQEFDLVFMLSQMADEFYPVLAAKGQTAVVEAPEHLMLYADPDKLARVFQNILKNAAAYGAEDSAVRISLQGNKECATVRISNQGNPIPKQKLETIFEKFYRLDSARGSNTGGAGLGLAIAKEIVTEHGGSISASSGREGTDFTVRLPWKQEELKKS